VQKSQWRPSQSRKESILNCLLIYNRGFKYTGEIKSGSRKSLDRIKKITDLLEEGKNGRKDKLTAACLKRL